MTPLEKSIIATISYFDIFDYPLTLMEIWKWLYVETGEPSLDIAAVQEALEKDEYVRQRVATKNGFYFLKNREDVIGTRLERYSLAERKYHRAKQMIRWLRFFPFIKMIGICNTLAYNNSRRDADIDLFIVTRRHRVWQARFWVTGWLKLFGLRPTPQKTKDTICSSFFVDEDHLDLHSLVIAGDVYLPYWIMQVVPVYDEGVYEQFIAANKWVRAHIPNSLPIMPARRHRVGRLGLEKKIINGKFSLWPERIFKSYQLAVMPDNLKHMANTGSQVVVNDHMLKFHDNDRRALFLQRWQQRLSEVL
jgi:hypothetical protein